MNKDIQKMSLDEFIDHLRQPKKKPSFKYRFWKFYYSNKELILITAITLLQMILIAIWIILVVNEIR
jgi:hypothetical protein